MNESKLHDLHVTTNQRRAPGAITVIDDITLFNAVALQLLLLVVWANDSASWVQFQLGLIVVIFIRSTFPSEADLTIPIPLRTLEAVFLRERPHLQQSLVVVEMRPLNFGFTAMIFFRSWLTLGSQLLKPARDLNVCIFIFAT